jgi:hypothetical protein
MSRNRKLSYAILGIIVLLVLVNAAYRYNSDGTYEFFGSNTLDVVSTIEDPVEQKMAYRNYWGRLITKRAFRKLFGIKTEDEGVIRYSIQVGSADGDREATATAYFIGTQVSQLPAMADIREQVERNFEKYYVLDRSEMDISDRFQFITDVIAEYLPGSGQFNGVFLIVKSGDVFADFNGIQIPMDITEEKMNEILEQVRPLEVPVRVGVFEENVYE